MIYFDDEYHVSRAETLNQKRFSARCRYANGWLIGERFDDRFDTQVGGFLHIAEQWIEPNGEMHGGWKRTTSGDIATERAPSLIVDYGFGGKEYTDEEAAAIPELSGVLVRLRERDAAYVAFLSEKAVANARWEARKRVREAELLKRHVRFLPKQVLKQSYANAGL